MTIRTQTAAGFGWPVNDYPGSGLVRFPKLYLMPDGGGGGGGGSGGEGPTEEEIQARIDEAVKAATKKAVEEAVAPLKAKNDEILGEKKKLKEDLDKFGTLDPERVKAVMDRLENDEEAKLIADGKVEEVIERRTERLIKDHEKALTASHDKITELETALAASSERLKSLVVDGALRRAIDEQEGFVSAAVEDAIGRGRRIFSVGENDELVASDGNGAIFGKDGKTPLTPGEWLEDMKEKAPHWWATNSGGGAGGSQGGGSKEINPFLPEHYNMTEQHKIAKEDRAKYDRLHAEAEKIKAERAARAA